MVRFPQMLRVWMLAAAGAAALTLASCSDYGGALPKHMRPLDEKTRELITRKGMDQKSPVLIRLFKEESTLEVWKPQKATGRYALLKTYEICAWSGVLGPKIKEGDRQAPEGFYTIRPAQMNPNSSYYLAFNMGYPNDFDRAHGRTGSELMVHGACSSRGCYSMTDESIQEIYTLGRLAFQGGQREFQVQAFPFRMTPENLARHADNPHMPFWLMLKEGYDHFEAVGQPPKVDVCDRRYVFNSVPVDEGSFNASAACPPMLMPEPIRMAIAAKEAKDQRQLLEIASKMDRQGKGRGAEALRLALAQPTTTQLAGPMSTPVTAVAAASAAPVAPATTASVEPAPELRSGEPEIALPQARPATPPVPTPAPSPAEPAAVATAPQPAGGGDSGFLPVPDLSVATSEPAPAPATTPPTAAAAPQPSDAPADAATLEERMLVGTATPDAGVANAYATASEDESGLTGLVLQLFRE